MHHWIEEAMIGGRVVETIILDDRVWVNITDYRDESAICLERTSAARTISPGDALWWNGVEAYWTPYETEDLHCERRVGPKDVPIPRVGFSGVPRPSKPKRRRGAHA